MILDDVIVEVRRIIQDDTVTYRYSDAFLLGLGNQALKRVQLLRPDLFAFVTTLACDVSEVLQTMPSDSMRLIEVYSIVGGVRLVEASREVLDQTLPNWPNDTAGDAINWMRHPRNPNKFFIYPQCPAAGQSLDIEYSQVPPTYLGATVITLLSDAYFPVMVDLVVFLVESVDNESVTSGRAKLFKDSYEQLLQVNLSNRPLTDIETAGLDPKKVKVV